MNMDELWIFVRLTFLGVLSFWRDHVSSHPIEFPCAVSIVCFGLDILSGSMLAYE